MLSGKRIIVGVTGGIAAYKTAHLVRLLVKEGCEVKVIMTQMAKQFITPLTLATLSKNPIVVDFYNPENGDWNSHVSLGLWADAFVIAPATANTLAKMVYGVADNLLVTSYLSSRCPVMVAPAMDFDMFLHPSTTSNLKILKERGVTVVEPSSGELASGLSGKGRMEEPENIVRALEKMLSPSKRFSGKRVMITAGPTVEDIDPVRYITNHSSGKMAYALAEEFAAQGAEVELVSGPVYIEAKHASINLHPVRSSDQMYNKCLELYDQNIDIAVLCAAVADYTPLMPYDKKLKRVEDRLSIELKATKDIAKALGERKKGLLVGFALETNNERENAARKLESKNLDMIVLNSLKDPGAGFIADTNKVTLLFKGGKVLEYDLKPKAQVAEDIIENINSLLCSEV